LLLRWLQLYNGNLDRSLPNRKSTAVLRGELKKWEEQQVILKKKGKPVVDSPIEHVVSTTPYVHTSKN